MTFKWITEDLPFDVGNRNQGARVFTVDSDAFDIALGDLPFNLHIDEEYPYERAPAPWRKEQFDNLSHVGEQSLVGWWLRSQIAFNGGAGITYFEPLQGRDILVESRFRDSRGVDVLREDGEVRLLPETIQLLSTASSDIKVKASDTRLLTLDGTVLRAFDGSQLGDQADFRAASQAASDGNSEYTCDKPTGTAHTDILVAFQSKETSVTPVTPTGGEDWQLLDEVHSPFLRTFVWWKIAGDDEPSEYTFFNTGESANGHAHGRVSVIAIQDAAQIEPAVTIANGSGTGVLVNSPAPDPEPSRGGVEIRFAANHDLTAPRSPWSPPATYDERTDVNAGTATGLSHTTATKQLLVGGDTGVQQFTMDSSSNDARHGITVNVLNSETATGVVAMPGSSIPTNLAYTGGKFLIGHATGIAELDADSGLLADALWTDATDPVQVWWLKQRIFAAEGRKVYELSLTGGDISAETPLYEHPDPNWQWVSMAETGSAVWMAGYSGDKSAIHIVALEPDGSVPTLAGATVGAQLPDGEVVNEILGYLDFLVVATNRGLRIAFVQGTTASLGPLIFPEPVYAVAARGDYVWAGLDQGLTRKVDLGRSISGDLTFAYANDLESAGAGRVTAFTWWQEKLVYGHGATGVMTPGPNLRPDGFVATGYIRYGVLEPKFYESVRTSADASVGQVELRTSINEENTHVASLANFIGSRDTDLNLPGEGKADRLSLIFRLERSSTDFTKGPALRGYQLRALPAPSRRQRLIRFPVKCFDQEADRWGNVKGGPHSQFAWARLRALEKLEENGVPVMVRDFRTGDSRICVVDSVSHLGRVSPSRDLTNFGGRLMVTVRTVD